jgi:predicted MPP superfamily phosphohydrolase
MHGTILRVYVIALLLHGYIGARLLADMPFGAPAIAATLALLLASAGAMPFGALSRRMKPGRRTDLLAGTGFVAMGLFAMLLILTLLRDLTLLAGFAAGGRLISEVSVGHWRSYSAAAVPVLAVILTLMGFSNARRRAGVRAVEVPIGGLPASLRGFSIVQITDIHIGTTIKRDYVDRIVDAVNELHADMIAITGDLVDGGVRQLSPHTAPLARLASRHGTFFVTGNHEYYSGADPWVAELRRLGIAVLMNEHVVLRHRGESVVVAGVTDYGAHHFDPAQRSDPVAAMLGAPDNAGVRLLLAHQPRSAFAAEPAGFDLQLSGHTHGGQFVPWNFLVRLQQPFSSGLHRLGKLWVYVSRGTGYWGPPLRLGSPSEITHLRLVPADE